MSEVVMTPATVAEAELMAGRLRSVEADELRAATGLEPAIVLHDGVLESKEAWSIYIDGELAGLWGVQCLDGHPRAGIAWLLTTEVVERRAKAFWKLCLDELPRLLSRWEVLVNAIDVRHEKAIRWAKRLGFKLEEPAPFGDAGLPFCFFQVTKGDLCAHRSR